MRGRQIEMNSLQHPDVGAVFMLILHSLLAVDCLVSRQQEFQMLLVSKLVVIIVLHLYSNLPIVYAYMLIFHNPNCLYTDLI